MENIKTMILCGGYGTRLQRETEFRPKPLVEIGSRPILWHIMKIFAHHNLRDFVLCLGYRGEMIKEYFLNYETMNNDFTIRLGDKGRIDYHDAHEEQDFTLTLANTGQDTMTGGRVARAAHYTNDTFMVTYGDGVADVDIGALLAFHRSHGKIGTMTIAQPHSLFGIVETDTDGRIRCFREKPKLDSWINIGFMVFERAFLDYLGGDDCVLEKEPLERLAADGQLMAYRHEGYFFAMDTYRDFKQLNHLWNEGQAPWKVWA